MGKTGASYWREKPLETVSITRANRKRWRSEQRWSRHGRLRQHGLLPYGGKLDYSEGVKLGDPRKPLASGAISKTHRNAGISSMNTPSSKGGWSSRVSSKNQLLPDKQHRSSKKSDQLLERSKGGKIPLSASVFGLDTADLTSTTTGLDSMLDNNTENNSSDDDLSTTIDATDAHAIRKQLEGLESMYSEVLKLLGVKKYSGRYQPSDPRINKRRLYGSMSSLPSSVSSRPIRDKRRQDERKKVKDIKGINKRFQRLESHVVTLARSVAHLSSEMRTQHLMIQEMENIRGEISALRGQTLAARSQSVPRGLNALQGQGDAALTNPTRKYAGLFETERVGMVELPYMTEEMLQKMGIPLGPRLRILQEAQISVQCRDKVYVVYCSSYHVFTLPPSTPAVSHQSLAKWSHPVCVPNLVSGAGEKLLYFRDNVIPRTCAGTKALRTG
uniref:SAM domain-containing protein n=1 Tax=Timema cristinae TaxID=61476 RepID=A0A7R9CYX5_TIMCR|nr:unnamed protein product [Timema cristinae]